MITKIENVLGKNTFKEIQEKALDDSLPWYYTGSTAYREHDDHAHILDGSFTHYVYARGEAFSPICDRLYQTFLNCLDAAGETLDTLYRLRLGLIIPTETTFVHAAHIDMDAPHRTALIYFNDSDGDTILYDNLYDFDCGIPSRVCVKQENLELLERHTPKANTFISFEGNRYHSSSTPTLHKRRIVLNCNYTVK